MTFAASYEASPESIALVRNQMAVLAADCGLDAQAIGDVRLAVSEAATNALVHGYRNRSGAIRVEAAAAAGELLIAITDDGLGMSPRDDSPGLGLGLPLIAKVAERVEVIDATPGTQLRMAFQCPRARVPGDAPVFT